MPSFERNLLTQQHQIHKKIQTLVYHGENLEFLSYLGLNRYQVVTDRRTDRRTDGRNRHS